MAEEELISVHEWKLVAEVAEHYPRLLAWLAEGQVGVLWNVFGSLIAILRLIPGVRWLLWYLVFRRTGAVAPWRVSLYQSILQERREGLNSAWSKTREKDSPQGIHIPEVGIPGLSAVNDEPLVLETKAGVELDVRIGTMTSGCVGISGLRGVGKTALIQDFCAHRYGTPRVPYPKRPTHFLPGLRVMVQAPLRFDPRDFLIHQYTCLCEAVLADVRFNPTTLTRQLLLPFTPSGRIRLGALFGALSGVIFFAGCAVLGYLAAHGYWPTPPDDLTSWEIAGAVVSGIAGLASIGWRTKRAAREVRQIVNLATDAEDRLQQLHYQRTDSKNAGAGLAGPMGASVSLGMSQEFTQQLMTLPELIADYREFIQRVVGALQQSEAHKKVRVRVRQQRENRNAARRAGWRSRASKQPWLLWLLWLGTRTTRQACRELAAASWAVRKAEKARVHRNEDTLGTEVRLIIGIDQMDQIDDPAAACKFLNELSAEFGISSCVYLLAIPTSAMSAADPRLVPVKTVSAGVFDEMTWVEPFGLGKSAELLSKRVIGLPPVLAALCYVLSGGLPRELLRVARSVVRTVQDPVGDHKPDLAEVIHAVVEEEVRALKHRTLATAVTADVSDTPDLMEQLTDADWPWNTSLRDEDPVSVDVRRTMELRPLFHLAAEPRASRNDAVPADHVLGAAVRDDFLTDLYYLLTVRGLFLFHQDEIAESYRTQGGPDAPFWVRPREPDPLVGLARARITLGINPRLAAELVTLVRAALYKRNETAPPDGEADVPLPEPAGAA